MENFETDIDECLKVLHAGGLILYPTDTVWGIGCDATNPTAVQRIYHLKQRAATNAMIVLVTEIRDVLKYVAAVDLSLFDYLDKTDRPTTVVYNGAIGLAQNLLAADGSIGIRICKDPFCRTLIKRFRKPIVSTSANLSGQPSPALFSGIGQQIKAGVDYIVQHRQQDTHTASPSSVIRWDNGSVVILRP
ncbi:MAG: L-threonylcarbamoyladenylate synthase [Chitinophagaceae bacterium]